jgi:PAS domain S-box-containing protein
MISFLYVDDEPTLLEICKIYLERTGEFSVSTCLSAAQALITLETRSFDAIIADYQMPEMDGIGFLKIVRSRFPKIPFILFTGRGGEEIAIKAFELGADFYVMKGGNPKTQFADIVQKVRQVMARRRAEEALQQSEEMLRTVTNYTYDWEYWEAPDHHIIYTTPSCERLTGYTWEEFRKDPGLINRIVFPDDRETWAEHLKMVKKRKDVLSIDFRIIRKDGNVRWVNHVCNPVIDMDGNLKGWRVSNRDETDRKSVETQLRAEQALRASEERYRVVTENSPTMIYIIDRKGYVRFVNPAGAAPFGKKPAAIIGRNIRTLFTKSFAERHLTAIQDVIREGRMITLELTEPFPSGSRWIDARLIPLRDKHGAINEVLGISEDITERRQAEDALRRTNTKLNLLNSVTRHDVNNQLLALLGFAQIAGQVNTDSRVGDFIGKIENAAINISRQIEFTRNYQNLGIKEPAWQDLEIILKTVRPNTVRFTTSCNNIEIYADAMLENVFTNLFDNALRHGEKITEISVRCEPVEDHLLIAVEDNGVGVPIDEKEKIFEKGFGKHTGFGLFLTREILAITGISIHEAGKPGSGARFEIQVPAGMFRSRKKP